MSQIIDGRKLASDIKLEVRREIVEKKLNPNLAVILVGDNVASQMYVKMKEQACHQVGVEFHKYLIPAGGGQQKLLECIDFLNNDDSVDAILIQLPLPAGFDENEAVKRLDPKKDVDGFHQENIKLLLQDQPYIIPGLPLGVLKLIEATKQKLKDKQTIIIANSDIFSEPLEFLLKKECAQVQTIKPTDKDLVNYTKQADILITAVGACDFIRGEMLKQGAIVIDIGINHDENNQLCGDVTFHEAEDVVDFITPVPGGVGPITVAMLLYNTLQLTIKNKSNKTNK